MEERKWCSIPCEKIKTGYRKRKFTLHTLREIKARVQTLIICLRYPPIESSGYGNIMAKAEYDRKKRMAYG